MENILWNTWQYLVDVFDCFLIPQIASVSWTPAR